MKIWFFAVVALAIASEEPEPINDQERNDEVAQSETRTRWVACLLISRTKLIKDFDSISEIYTESSFKKEFIQRRIIADILYKCDKVLTSKQAEELLVAEDINLEAPGIKELTIIDKEFYLNEKSDIRLTQQQEELVKKILIEANKVDEEIEVEAPIVDDFDPSVYSQNKDLLPTGLYYPGLIGGVFLLIGLGFFIIKRVSSLKNQKEDKVAPAKKKSRKDKKDQ
ncbi:unnamed protein product [Blepharisma stoltei]|uniref:Uncharacterized protein n=1 Tax=Blepharisma stoltei TaxID=1481888 RepID=A0AAU9IJP9_9CILI|nr:unnamed protein product [Blepharisma stoltei]